MNFTTQQAFIKAIIAENSHIVKNFTEGLDFDCWRTYNGVRNLRLIKSDIRWDGWDEFRPKTVAMSIQRNQILNEGDGPTTAAQEEEIGACCLKPGQHGVVVRLQGDAGLRHQLLEMGFTKGTVVEFIRRAPLGDPIDLRLRGYHLSLRHDEANAVVVKPQPARLL